MARQKVKAMPHASVAQLEVQHPSKVKVAGSNPVGGARGGDSLTLSKTSHKFVRYYLCELNSSPQLNRLIDAIGQT